MLEEKILALVAADCRNLYQAGCDALSQGDLDGAISFLTNRWITSRASFFVGKRCGGHNWPGRVTETAFLNVPGTKCASSQSWRKPKLICTPSR